MDQPTTSKPSTAMNIRLDYRAVIVVLVLVIIGMLGMWKPWQPKAVADRTVEVTGQATISAKPDEFIFYPAYNIRNNDRQAALKELSTKSDEIVGKLKALGVSDSKIKTNSDSWYYPYYDDSSSMATTYTLRLTVTVTSQDLAQKVQDYLLTTSPTGAISPQANFSEAKRNELENQARDKASKDARSKADQSAKNLGFKISRVKSVNDGAGFGGPIYPYAADSKALSSVDSVQPSLTVQPGENDLTYTVTVAYYIR